MFCIMQSRRRAADARAASLAAGDGDYLSRSTTDGTSVSDKSDGHGVIPGPINLDGPSSCDAPAVLMKELQEVPPKLPSDVQQFLKRFTCAYGVADIVRSLHASCLPLSDNCLKLIIDDATEEESLRWLWLVPVYPAGGDVASILEEIRLIETTNGFAKTDSDNYCTAFRMTDWIWYVKEKSNAQQGDVGGAGVGGNRNLVVLLEKHSVEYPIDLGNLATLGVDRLTGILRQITLAFEVFRKFDDLPPIETLRWRLTLGVHEDEIIEFWFNQQLHIARSHGVQARLTPTSLFGNNGVDLAEFLEATLTQVPSLRSNADLVLLSRMFSRTRISPSSSS